ncbi:MAG: hypothetical protein H6624_03825 [Bdellovibrionaceae bacterium]|nr:hypothetical protein [Bdellovibrionales bacterium]MCB9083442.1 hypothetical protein [Pseudobdellovibrionaceae bacterium]
MSNGKETKVCDKIRELLAVMDELQQLGCVPCYYGGVSQVEYEIVSLSVALNGHSHGEVIAVDNVHDEAEETFVQRVDEWIRDLAA